MQQKMREAQYDLKSQDSSLIPASSCQSVSHR